MIRSVHCRSWTRNNPPCCIEMYCHTCGAVFWANNMNAPCKECRSTAVVPAGKWRPARDRWLARRR
jgi:hypothetical protein